MWRSFSGAKKLFIALAFFHLVVLASGMTGWRKHAPRPIRLSVNGYEVVTGAGGGFGFFSPNVGHQLLMNFEVEGGETKRIVTLDELLPREVAVRSGNMVRLFASAYGKENYRRSIAASFAANVFERFPEARKIKLQAFAYRFPGLTEFRSGARPELDPIYSISFRRRQ